MRYKTIIPLLMVLLGNCSKSKEVPMSTRLQKSWSVQQIITNGTTLFSKGAAGNLYPGYSNFRLDLSNPSTVRLTEWDGNSFQGVWEISSDQKTLILKNLSPEPTGTKGTMSYTINSVTDSQLTLTSVMGSVKTGGTINEFQLTNP